MEAVGKQGTSIKEHLFTKELSKQSIGVYMELYREVGITFEAAPLLNSGKVPGSEGGPQGSSYQKLPQESIASS
jgi:hypothetical protein